MIFQRGQKTVRGTFRGVDRGACLGRVPCGGVVICGLIDICVSIPR